MSLDANQLPELPCPECRMSGHAGGRIGNRRGECRTCNNFAQAVMRRTRSQLIKEFPAEYERLRLRVERDLYPRVYEEFIERERLG